MTEYQRARQLEEHVPELLALVGRAYALSGKKAEAQKVIDELKELSKRAYVPPYNFAIIFTPDLEIRMKHSPISTALMTSVHTISPGSKLIRKWIICVPTRDSRKC